MVRVKMIAKAMLLTALVLPMPVSAQDPEVQAQNRLKGMDADQNGSVTLAEFTEHRKVWTAKREDAVLQMQPEVVQRAFDKIDRDADGSLSFAELLAQAKAAQKRK